MTVTDVVFIILFMLFALVRIGTPRTGGIGKKQKKKTLTHGFYILNIRAVFFFIYYDFVFFFFLTLTNNQMLL